MSATATAPATSMSLPLIHDDNQMLFVRNNTTLLLTSHTLSLSQESSNVNTASLIMYTSSLYLPPSIKLPSKNLEIHCQDVQFASQGSTLDVSGADGQESPAVGPQTISNGGSGGNLTLHIQNAKFKFNPTGFRLWSLTPFQLPAPAPAPVSTPLLRLTALGGKASKSSDTPGTVGANGTVTLLFGNQELRASTALSLAYGADVAIPDRLQVMNQTALPKLNLLISALEAQLDPALPDCQAAKDVTTWKSQLTALNQTTQASQDLHVSFVRLSGLLDKLPGAEYKQYTAPCASFLTRLIKLKDYSQFTVTSEFKSGIDTACTQIFNFTSAKTVASKDVKAQFFDNLKVISDIIATQESKANWAPDYQSPLAVLVTAWLTSFNAYIDASSTEIKAIAQPSDHFEVRTVTVDDSVGQDLTVTVPLAHPSQCQMMFRTADAAFFASDFTLATSLYEQLRDSLMFVPTLLDNTQDVQTKGATASKLLSAYLFLENSQQLSLWTMESLALIYDQVCRRLEQIALSHDMFGLEKDWVPRLSYAYYSDYARQQLERLKGYEASYWAFWDANQIQMATIQGLQTASAVNLFRTRDAEERLKSSIKLMKDKISDIDKAADAIAKLQTALIKDINDAKELFDDNLEWPSLQSIFTIFAGIAICVATGGAAAVLGGAAAGLGAMSAYDEINNTVKDATGQAVRKDVLVKKMATCGSDIESLFKTAAYTTNSDGTRVVNQEDSVKIAVTQKQLDGIIEQFSNKLGDKPALKTSLKKFVDAANNRNQDILIYNSAVLDIYLQMKNKASFQQQAQEIGSGLIGEGVGLPAIVAFYQRVRDDSRVAILRTIKYSALALQFWGLRDVAKFASPNLLSQIDMLEAHMQVLLNEFEAIASRYSSFTLSVWPVQSAVGVLHKISSLELNALKLALSDPTPDIDVVKDQGRPKVHTVVIKSLSKPVTTSSNILATPFAGQSNIRISSVKFWVPGLKVGGQAVNSQRLQIEIVHLGSESIVDPDDVVWSFKHPQLYITCEYDWSMIKSLQDIGNNNAVLANQVMPLNVQTLVDTKLQSPVGPFTEWRITIREKDNGLLDFSEVKDAYLEFTGSSFPFRR